MNYNFVNKILLLDLFFYQIIKLYLYINKIYLLLVLLNTNIFGMSLRQNLFLDILILSIIIYIYF